VTQRFRTSPPYKINNLLSVTDPEPSIRWLWTDPGAKFTDKAVETGFKKTRVVVFFYKKT